MALKDILRASAEAEIAQLKATTKSSEKSTERTTTTTIAKQEKNKGGRPKKESDQLRKQYTLTLRPETYQKVMEHATKAELSFAKYMERAVLYYMENHKQ